MADTLFAPERPELPATRTPWRSLDEPARWTARLLVACVVWAVFTAGTSVVGIIAIDRDPLGEKGWLDVSDVLDPASGVFGAVVGIPAIVVFLVWFARAHHNVRLRGIRARSPAWACWSWFVPVATLVVPYLATRDLWRAGDETTRTGLLLPAWWATWLGSGAFSVAAGVVRPVDSEQLERFRTAYVLDLATVALTIPCAFLAIAIVRRATARIDALRVR